MKCRHCGSLSTLRFIDLGTAPPSNAYVNEEDLTALEGWLPLKVIVCETCWLVQTEDYTTPDTYFTKDYAYFSSVSSSWLAHARSYVEQVSRRFELGPESCVVEVAANDGYLLQYVKEAGIPCYGIEPTASTAAAARAKSLEIIEAFFGTELGKTLAREKQPADLIVANNVLAHVPDINDFLGGFVGLLKSSGVATFEFPHLLRLVEERQFDTIYHEHFSYFSLSSIKRIFEANGLTVFDVEPLSTHGGSLRIFAERTDTKSQAVSNRVADILREEAVAGVGSREYYSGFQTVAEQVKNDLVAFLLDCKKKGLTVAAYGAAAKGNTLINFAGVRADLLPYVVDRAASKQGKYLPGSRIPIVDEEHLREHRPDRLLLLPWNLRDELVEQLRYIEGWGGRFVVAIPELSIIEGPNP